jgi:dephospho-CoA kinase
MTFVLGLTGSIGMGKSTVAGMFARAGVPVFDADAEVRRLQGPSGKLLGPIEAMFPGTTGALGVERARLAEAVLHDKAALRRLERLIHPAVEQARRAFLRRNRGRRLIVVDIPLLFEKGGWRRVDAIAVVSAAPWQQAKRVLGRAAMNPAKLAQIRALQTPDPEKRARADFIIPTGGTILKTRAKVMGIVACLSARAVRYSAHA